MKVKVYFGKVIFVYAVGDHFITRLYGDNQ